MLVFLAIANSAIANSNAGSNAATRTWFAMGRIHLLPAILGRTHPRYRSPHVAVFVQFVIGVTVALWLGAQYNSPFLAFAILGTIIGAVVIAIYMTVNLACLLYYAREQRSEFNWFLHGVIPILGILAFIPAFLVAIGVGGSIFDFISPLPYPFSVVGPVVGSGTCSGSCILDLPLRAEARASEGHRARVHRGGGRGGVGADLSGLSRHGCSAAAAAEQVPSTTPYERGHLSGGAFGGGRWRTRTSDRSLVSEIGHMPLPGGFQQAAGQATNRATQVSVRIGLCCSSLRHVCGTSAEEPEPPGTRPP